MNAVVLDANALLMPFQFRMNLDKEISRLLGEIRVMVPSSVVDELSRLQTREAKAALALAGKYELVETGLDGDDGVLDVAVRNEAAVVTNDRELMSRLKEAGLPVVRLRSERYLVLTGEGPD
ncbi:MAG: twitching motility protein PilT [Thermoplasmata archaeon]|nr:twitching motility protein PilT [Thermoplasmata archaeon]